jgi:predicted ABC-type transport system involved in lysophospholipase L1 biosynthesis ATPase subunit
VLTAYENVECPVLLLGVPVAARRTRAAEMLDAVGLGAERRTHARIHVEPGDEANTAMAENLLTIPRSVVEETRQPEWDESSLPAL